VGTPNVSFDLRTQEIIGSSNEQWDYDTYNDHIHPDDRERASEARFHALEQRTIYQVEYRLYRPDGALRLLANRAQAFYDEDGHPSDGSSLI